jgi:uncharacterized protein
VQAAYERDPGILVWWATETECVSAMARLERRGELTGKASATALDRLDALKSAWHEVQPLETVRRLARRLLRVHELRAADSLQLAAALAAAEGQSDALELVSLDDRLVEAARREGFRILELSPLG